MARVECEPQVLVNGGFEAGAADTAAKLLTGGRGLVFVCGPPGSGRTSTLHSLLSAINRVGCSVVAAERDSSRELEGVTQIKIDEGLDTDFSTWIEGAMRMDADVIMVGELATSASVMSAVRAASRRLVLTRHDGLCSIAPLLGLLELGASPSLICTIVAGVISVRLLERLCPLCRLPTQFPSELFAPFPPLDVTAAALNCYEAPGCDACDGTGRQQHVPVYEVVSVGPQVQRILEQESDRHRLMRAGRQATTLALLSDGLRRMDRGLVDARQVAALGAGVSFDLPHGKSHYN